MITLFIFVKGFCMFTDSLSNLKIWDTLNSFPEVTQLCSHRSKLQMRPLIVNTIPKHCTHDAT